MPKNQSLPQATKAQAGLVLKGAGVPTGAAGTLSLSSPVYEIWVDPAGNDTTGDGRRTNPFATLGKAFAVIIAADPAPPLGWVVQLPPGHWYEDVGMPPPNVTLRGAGAERTTLAGAAGVALTWAELEVPGVRALEGLTIVASVTGKDAGNLSLSCWRCGFSGATLTNVGLVELDGCTSLPTLTNLGALLVRGHRPRTPQNLALTYDPTTASNGLGTPGHRIEGGAWGSISYAATDAGAPLELIGARATGLTASDVAIVRARASAITGTLTAQDAGSLVDYDGPALGLTFGGSGSFIVKELLLFKNIGSGASEGDVTITMPKIGGGLSVQPIFVSFNKPGGTASYVSSTASTVTLHITPPTGAPAFQIRALVRPA